MTEARTAQSRTRGFLFADLRGYTAFVESRGDHAAADLLDAYRALVRDAVVRFDGAEIRTEGDSFYVVFQSASAAVRCGLEIVESSRAASAAEPSRPIRVGVGVHAGETVETTEGFVGSAVNIAARVCALAGEGDVLVTDTVRSLTRTFLDVGFVPLGRRPLKGVVEPIAVYRVVGGAAAERHRRAGGAYARRWSWRLTAGIAAAALLATTAVGAAVLGRGSAAATPSPGSPTARAAAATPTPGATTTTPASILPVLAPPKPGDPFPTATEWALLMSMKAAPDSFAEACQRGPYDAMVIRASPTRATPTASLVCTPGISTGAGQVFVQQFAVINPSSRPGGVHGGPDNFVAEWISTEVASNQVLNAKGQVVFATIPPGDCATSPAATGRWSVAGEDRGAIVCFIDIDTGDAILEWSYEQEEILVRARNPRGDSAALYGFYERTARFIGP